MATTLEAIQAKMKKLQAQADALIAKESTTVLKAIHELMERHGLTTADIDAHAGGKQRAKKAGTKAATRGSATAAKYRDPKTGATWSGHGRAPGWIASAKNRDKFLVGGRTATKKAAPASKAKAAGNYVRGPQPAMYRDPRSGATWSGRGRAPAWLAGAKDRTVFLIAGGGDGAAKPKAPAVKKAAPVKRTPAKTVATKKTVAKKEVVTKSARTARKALAKKAAGKKSSEKQAAPTTAVVKEASADTVTR